MADNSGVEEESSSLSRGTNSAMHTARKFSEEASEPAVLNSVDLPTLSKKQRARIVCNRERALSLRRARVNAKPYQLAENVRTTTIACSSHPRTFEDTHGGFVLEVNTAEEERLSQLRSRPVVQDDAPALPDEQLVCDECGKLFAESFLWSKFSVSVCNSCRDMAGNHQLITKTEAKEKFLLKDCDFDRRDPPLPYLVKRNPHSSRGDMKLYLLSQVRERSHEIWDGREGLEKEKERRLLSKEKKKLKKYAKEVKALRRAVYSSSGSSSIQHHQHSYPPESEEYDTSSDTWTKTCPECGHQVTFEKM